MAKKETSFKRHLEECNNDNAYQNRQAMFKHHLYAIAVYVVLLFTNIIVG